MIVLRGLFAYLLALAPPVGVYLLLRGEEGIVFLTVYGFSIVTLSILRTLFENDARAGKREAEETAGTGSRTARGIGRAAFFLEIAGHLTGATIIVVSLNLTPASAYLAWFRLVQEGDAAGILSFMFSVKVAFFAAVFASLSLRRRAIIGLLGTVTSTLIVLYAVYQSAWIAVAFVFSAVLTAIAGLIVSGHVVTAKARKAAASREAAEREAVTQEDGAGAPGTAGVAGSATGAGATAGSTGPAAPAQRTDRISRRPAPLIQMIIASAALAIPLSFTDPANFNFLVNTLPEHSVVKTVTAVFPDFPFLYNMPGYGHQLGENDIGGRPSLTKRPVFRVQGKSGETVYLRTAVYDRFTGRGWAQTRSDETETIEEVFAGESPEQLSNPLRVDIMIDFFSSVPHTLDTSRMYAEAKKIPELEYAGYDTGFLFHVPVVRGTTFYLERQEPGGRTPETIERYTDLPSEIPSDVIELARRLEGRNVNQTIANIENFLGANYYYTLEAPTVSGKENPVWGFLSGQGGGYCVHFASSMTLLARMNGIPARYVTGFLVYIPSDSNETIVSGYGSHAWVEIWDEKRGWRTVEATPPMNPEFYDDPLYFERYNPFDSDYTGTQLDLIMGDRVSRPQPEEKKRELQIDLVPVMIVLVSLAAVSAALLFVLYSSYSPLTRERRLQTIARRMVKRSRRGGVSPPSSVGWRRWAAETAASTHSDGAELGQSAELLLEVFFGDRKVSTDDIGFLRSVFRNRIR